MPPMSGSAAIAPAKSIAGAARVARSRGSGPPMTAVRSAASSTLRASGPSESSVVASGTTPARLITPYVGLSPVSPHSPEGMRIEPPVSEPTAAGARPAATATAEPLLEPPATRCVFVSQGFHGAPIGALRPQAPYANSTRCVLPSGIMPAASRCVVAVALSLAMPWGRAFDPAVVIRPRICTRSLIAIGSPCNGPRASPEWRSRSAAAAAASASSRYTSMKACR